jgi:hypothetical protein
MTETPLIGILVGIIIWLVTNAASFLLRGYRLKNALIEDIRHRISNLEEIESYLDEYFKNNIKEGVSLEDYARYTKEKFPFYEDVREDLYKYFGTKRLITIMRCYEALEEIEILMAGLNRDFYEYGKKKVKLSAGDVILFERKKDRIISVVKILNRTEIRSMSDLPTDYRGMMSAASIIKK